MIERLSTHALVKRFGPRAVVDGISLEIKRGEVVGLLGPNGAGKTTTFYMIVGIYRPDGGTVRLDDQDITRLPMFKRARMGISYLAQEASIFRKLSVEDNILAILETLSLPKQQERERLEALLRELSIEGIRKSPGYTLSGGERRRVEITRALVTKPAFILLDEPFAGIDPIAVGEIQSIVSQLRDRGIGVLITDHNVRETLGICDRAYIIHEGRVLEHGVPEQIAGSEKARRIYLGEKFQL